MKQVGYFVVGIFMKIIDVVTEVTKRGDIAVSNYNFWKRVEKKKKEAK